MLAYGTPEPESEEAGDNNSQHNLHREDDSNQQPSTTINPSSYSTGGNHLADEPLPRPIPYQSYQEGNHTDNSISNQPPEAASPYDQQETSSSAIPEASTTTPVTLGEGQST